jgi:hypothetical protein
VPVPVCTTACLPCPAVQALTSFPALTVGRAAVAEVLVRGGCNVQATVAKTDPVALQMGLTGMTGAHLTGSSDCVIAPGIPVTEISPYYRNFEF